MKQLDDDKTNELPLPKTRGRPASGHAKSNAQRQAEYRARRAPMPLGDYIPKTIKRLAKQFDLTEREVTQHLLRFALRNRNWPQLGFPTEKDKT